MDNGRHRYVISGIPYTSSLPNWMSYSGEGCSLSFHIPPVFHGLVVWVDKDDKDDKDTDVKIIIRNNSNGIRLFQFRERFNHPKTGWIKYITRSQMAMEDYCADDELELCIYSESFFYGHSFEPAPIKECGVHVIAGKSDSFEELAVGRDAVMPSPPLYHLLPHPHCGSITASTPKQWSDYLFAKLQEYNFTLTFHGKKKYFL